MGFALIKPGLLRKSRNEGGNSVFKTINKRYGGRKFRRVLAMSETWYNSRRRAGGGNPGPQKSKDQKST